MNKDLLVYHYFFNQRDPFLTCMELKQGSIESLVDLNIPMQGYDYYYYRKRKCREKICRDILLNKGGDPKTEYPYYFTLGCQDELFLKQRHHTNSVAIPLSELPQDRILFLIGDSIGISDSKLKSSLFSYEEFIRDPEAVISQLPSVEKGDRYIEVQLWDDEPLRIYRPQYVDTVGICDFVGNLVRIGLNARGYVYKDISSHAYMNLCKLLRCFQNQKPYSDWKRMWITDIDSSVIPKGIIHGIPHSVKTSLLALVLADRIGLPPYEALFVSKCAAYHDIGRNIGNQYNHAKLSGAMIKRYFDNYDERSLAELTIRFHDVISDRNAVLTDNKKAFTYAKILHDADSLDYLRFGICAFDSKYLLLKESMDLFLLSCELNLCLVEFNDWDKRLFGINLSAT